MRFGSWGKRENWNLVKQSAVSSISPVLRQTGIQVWGQMHTHKFYYSWTLSEILKGILKLKSNTIKRKTWLIRSQWCAGKYVTTDSLGGKALICSVSDFCAMYTPMMADIKLSTWCHWTQHWKEWLTINSYESVWAGSIIPLQEIVMNNKTKR